MTNALSRQSNETSAMPDALLFQDAVSKLRASRFRFWLCEGALLGLTRDGALIPWDTDIDFGVWAHEVDERAIRNAFPDYRAVSFFPRGIECVHLYPMGIETHRHIEVLRYTRRGTTASHWTSYLLYPGGLPERFVWFAEECIAGGGYQPRPHRWLQTRLKGAIYRVVTWLCRRHSVRELLIRAVKAWYAGPRAVPLIYECAARFFTELEERLFLGVPCPAPRDVEAYLGEVYGVDWRTPRRFEQWHDGATRRGNWAHPQG